METARRNIGQRRRYIPSLARCALVGSILFFQPGLSFAQTAASLQAEINAVQTDNNHLQEQIRGLRTNNAALQARIDVMEKKVELLRLQHKAVGEKNKHLHNRLGSLDAGKSLRKSGSAGASGEHAGQVPRATGMDAKRQIRESP